MDTNAGTHVVLQSCIKHNIVREQICNCNAVQKILILKNTKGNSFSNHYCSTALLNLEALVSFPKWETVQAAHSKFIYFLTLNDSRYH